MRRTSPLRSACSITIFFLALLCIAVTSHGSDQYGVLTGTVRDTKSNEPLSNVTLRVENSGRTAITSDEGKFRIVLPYGDYLIVFSRVGHLPDTASIQIQDSSQSVDIPLQSTVIELPGTHVYERQYDPAQLIIRSAILRKKNILDLLQDYYFTAYTKLLISKSTEEDSTGLIEYITETQLQGYWQKPNRYKEILIARRQSANIDAENNLVTIGEILNFNQNRLEIGKYAVVSPTATDAMDFYNYYLIDTLELDGRRLFRLEIEPKSQTTPLFVGTIDIADSTFAVAGVDVGFNKVFEGGIFRNARYNQHLSPFQDSIWMPTEIRFTGDIKIPIPGIPMYHLDYVAALHEYHFNDGLPKGVMNEFALEVDPKVDKIDSATWQAQTTIPLTEAELEGYHRIDSVHSLPKPIGKRILLYSLGAISLLFNKDFFHYNRVGGAYFGAGITLRDLVPALTAKLRAGYMDKAERWAQAYRLDYQFIDLNRLAIRGEYHDEFRKQAVDEIDPGYDPTFEALCFGQDPYDYYHDRGFSVGFGVNLLRQTRVDVGYLNSDQFTVRKQTDHSFFETGREPVFRDNPAIAEGTDRALTFAVQFDNRPLIKNKNQIVVLTPVVYTRIGLTSQVASPDLTHSSFDYRRYQITLVHNIRTFDLGIFTIDSRAGVVTGKPGPQHAFSSPAFSTGGLTGFKTMNDSSFAGTRMLSIYAAQDFGRIIFKKLHLPLNSLPIGLQLFGGAFWYDYHQSDSTLGPVRKPGAERPYTEVGLGINRIPPLGLGMFFTFKLSGHAGYDFAFQLAGMTF